MPFKRAGFWLTQPLPARSCVPAVFLKLHFTPGEIAHSKCQGFTGGSMASEA